MSVVEPLTSHFTPCVTVPVAASTVPVCALGAWLRGVHMWQSLHPVVTSLGPPEHTGPTKRAVPAWHGLSMPDTAIFLEVQVLV